VRELASDPRDGITAELRELVARLDAQLNARPLRNEIAIPRADAVVIVGSLNGLIASIRGR
jgi:hypothetical protein